VNGHATCVDGSIYKKYRCGVAETTTIRISRDTHERVKRLAAERHETIDETVSRAIRALRQDALARDLAAELSEDETAWLDADAG
jgi:predicted transcriptional regulator